MILKPVAKIIPKNMTRLNYLTFTDDVLPGFYEFQNIYITYINAEAPSVGTPVV